MDILRKVWKKSKIFRVFLIAAITWFVLRLLFQIAFQSDFGAEWFLADDMVSYKLAAERLISHASLYLPEEMQGIMAFQYAPSYALAYFPLTRLPIPVLSIGWMLIQVLAYLLLWFRWNSLLKYLGLSSAREILVRTLPAWLLFSTFWSDLAYANVYIIMALLATLLIEAILKRRLGWSIFWLGIILQIKPQWAFAVFIPLCQRDWKFLFRLVAGAGLLYLACAGATMLAVGSGYALSQYTAYFRFMASLDSYYPWTELPFLGYNHSILATVIHFTGLPFSTLTVGIATVVKLIVLSPLFIVSWRFGKVQRSKVESLMLALGWYLGIFIAMDVIWEASLALAILALLWPTLHSAWEKWGLGSLIGIYVVLDIIRLAGYLIGGDAVLWQDSYLLTDPAIYIPIILLVFMVLYAALLRVIGNSKSSEYLLE